MPRRHAGLCAPARTGEKGDVSSGTTRRRVVLGLAGLAAGAWCSMLGACKDAPPPDDHTPQGAYALLVLALEEGRERDVFPYLEDEAQWASYTIRRERADALERAKTAYPADAYRELDDAWGVDARAPDGADVFARIGKVRGWFARLRKDLSGVVRVEQDGDRATIVTARGSRYPMRRRAVGIWGLTAFTAELEADAERATRDRKRVEEAARDYELASKGEGGPHPDASTGGVDAASP